MTSYSIYNPQGYCIADVIKRIGDEMITTKDGHWDYDDKGRKWVFDGDLVYTATLHQVRIYIFASYHIRVED